MRPVTTFAIGAAIGLVLTSGVAAAAATGVGGRWFGSTEAGTEAGTARFTGAAAGNVATSAAPVDGRAAVDAGGYLAGGSPAPAGATGSAASTGGNVTTSGGINGPGARAGGRTTATASGSARAPSLGSVSGAVDGVAQSVRPASGAVAFSTGGGGPIVGVDVSSTGQTIVGVP